MIKKRGLIIFFPIYVILMPLHAATVTGSFNATATISSTCSVSTNALAFGSYNPTLGTVLDATTTLGVTCTNGTTYNVGLDEGIGSGASVATRKMTRVGGSNTVNYTLYQDSTRLTVWGKTIDSDTVSGTGSGVAQTLTIYGRILTGNTGAPPASYSDTVTVTVTY